MSTAKEDVSSPAEQLRAWFIGRLPDGWFAQAPVVAVDREEITVVGQLDQPETEPGSAEAERAAAADGRARRFREETREDRIEIAREAELTFGRKVSWGVICDDRKVMFTTLSVPVMTRLRQSERRGLGTPVGAGSPEEEEYLGLPGLLGAAGRHRDLAMALVIAVWQIAGRFFRAIGL